MHQAHGGVRAERADSFWSSLPQAASQRLTQQFPASGDRMLQVTWAGTTPFHGRDTSTRGCGTQDAPEPAPADSEGLQLAPVDNQGALKRTPAHSEARPRPALRIPRASCCAALSPQEEENVVPSLKPEMDDTYGLGVPLLEEEVVSLFSVR